MYASINGLNMYYEVHGEGRPLVLLHGNLSTIEVDFGRFLPSLAKNRQIIAVEQQAHGRTADIERPLRTTHWAADTAALLQHIGIDNADIFGYSSGSAAALHLATNQPHLVRKLVLASFAYNIGGLHPSLLDGIQDLQPEHLAGTSFEESYARLAPRPQDWPRLIEKIKEMDADVDEWPAETIKALGKPTLLLYGDSDIVQPEHAVHVFRLLGGGVIGDLVGLPSSRLAIVPGTTHITLMQRGEWLTPMIEEFLDAD